MAAIPDTYKLTATSIQLKDVYNIAQKVGEEFQTLIQKFGGSHTAMLVEMVIAILEHLENLVDVANHIQIKHCQLLLHRDNLLREKEEIKATLALSEREKDQLKKKLEEVQTENEMLYTQQQANHLVHVASNNKSAEVSAGEDGGVVLHSASEVSDAMEIPRMKRKMQQLENELRRTKTKLLSAQKTMQCIVTENSTLKYDLGVSRAERGVLELELESHERKPGNSSSNTDEESPKFFKNDLLSVLQEKNELKEELESVHEQLRMTKLQLYQPLPPTTPEGHPLCDDCSFTRSRVRTIVTSITVPSVKERSRTPKKLQQKS